MNNKHHTLDPWAIRVKDQKIEIRPVKRKGVDGWSIGYAPIATVAGDKRLIDDEARLAIAHLMSSAPELLKALEDIVRAVKTSSEDKLLVNDDAIIKAEAAISKAKGLDGDIIVFSAS